MGPQEEISGRSILYWIDNEGAHILALKAKRPSITMETLSRLAIWNRGGWRFGNAVADDGMVSKSLVFLEPFGFDISSSHRKGSGKYGMEVNLLFHTICHWLGDRTISTYSFRNLGQHLSTLVWYAIQSHQWKVSSSPVICMQKGTPQLSACSHCHMLLVRYSPIFQFQLIWRL